MIKIQIKSIWGTALFEYEKENNTLKDTLEEAIRQGANLTGANLTGANLYRASLTGANLDGANLYRANLYRASLTGANLTGANLDGANLYRASLDGANLYRASLDGANLTGTNLDGTNLDGATNVPFIPFACPSDGAFIGWKKVNNHLIMLEIPADAKRCSCTSQKCRCDKARVLGITNLATDESVSEIKNTSYSPAITYVVGEMVYPDSFDENRWNECSHGIHFFINKQNAINY